MRAPLRVSRSGPRLPALALGSLLALAATGCGPRSQGTACGIKALAGATLLLDRFSTPRQALAEAPLDAPAYIPVRVAAGPALRGAVGLLDSGWVVEVEGTVPENSPPGFGVLVVGEDGRSRGILLFTGRPIRGAPELGRVSAGGKEVPLLGLRTDPTSLEDPVCPFFPDSLRRP